MPLCPEFVLLAQIVYTVAPLSSVGVPVIVPVSLVERPGIVPSNSSPRGNAGEISQVSISPPAVIGTRGFITLSFANSTLLLM